MKRGKESFSDVILRLIEKHRTKGLEVLEKYAGKLEDEELEKVVMGERRKFQVRRFDNLIHLEILKERIDGEVEITR